MKFVRARMMQRGFGKTSFGTGNLGLNKWRSTMFENLTDKLQRVFKNLRGQGKLTDEHLEAALGQIREAMLDGDVNLAVVDELIEHIKAKAVGAEVMLQLSPDQQVVKIVRDELADLLGREAKPQFASRPPSVWLLVGLQGAGKTTTTGKMGKWLSEHGHRPILVSTDVYRPAAREQLAQVAKATGTPLWPGTGTQQASRNCPRSGARSQTGRLRRNPGRHRRPSPHRRRIDVRARRAEARTHASRNPLRSRRDDRPGRSKVRRANSTDG